MQLTQQAHVPIESRQRQILHCVCYRPCEQISFGKQLTSVDWFWIFSTFLSACYRCICIRQVLFCLFFYRFPTLIVHFNWKCDSFLCSNKQNVPTRQPKSSRKCAAAFGYIFLNLINPSVTCQSIASAWNLHNTFVYIHE